MRSKGQISLNFDYHVNSKIFIPNILNRIINLLLGSCPRCGSWGAGWVKNLSVRICEGAPSTAHSSLSCFFLCIFFLFSFSFLLLSYAPYILLQICTITILATFGVTIFDFFHLGPQPIYLTAFKILYAVEIPCSVELSIKSFITSEPRDLEATLTDRRPAHGTTRKRHRPNKSHYN